MTAVNFDDFSEMTAEQISESKKDEAMRLIDVAIKQIDAGFFDGAKNSLDVAKAYLMGNI